MIFDIEEKPGTRFEMEDGGWIELRLLSPEDWIKVRRASVSHKPFAHRDESGKWLALSHEIVDEALQSEMINDLAITAWGDLKDGKGNEIPCTREMKNRLMRLKDPKFRDFVNEKIAVLNDLENRRREEAEKN